MYNLNDVFKNLRRLDLTREEVQDSLYRISDWLTDEEHNQSDEYIQKQLLFLSKFIKDAEDKNKYYFSNKCE